MYRTILLSSLSVVILAYTISFFLPNDNTSPSSPELTNLTRQALSLPLNSTSIILSSSPLLIYIPTFLTPSERSILLTSSPTFQESGIFGAPSSSESPSTHRPHRTSTSSFLSSTLPISQILTLRATSFITNLSLPAVPISFYGLEPPQLVRYASSQYYDLHHDYFTTALLPDPTVTSFWRGGEGRLYNRVASFFIYVDTSGPEGGGDEEGLEGGGTWFPEITVDVDGDAAVEALVRHGAIVLGDKPDDGGVAQNGHGNGEQQQQPEQDAEALEMKEKTVEKRKGVTIMPKPGAAVFWVNLDEQGYGDERTLHAGLPVTRGSKVGCNLWVKRDFGW